jgi:hypothetical protein
MTSNSGTDSWYLKAEDYYVPAGEAAEYPVRQGDIFPADGHDLKGWHGCQLVHPTCELVKSSVSEVQVVRVEPVSRIGNEKEQASVIAGFREKDGSFQVAQAHTFFLPPWKSGDPPLFSNLREVTLVDKAGFTQKTRLAALTHEARVSFIRRDIYFRYRQLLPFAEVKELEANRISSDSRFVGPRPVWAPEKTA